MTRISTGMLYQQSLSAMQSKQASLARTQNELTTGKKLLTAKDDPVGMATAQQAARRYLGYFTGPLADWTCPDQRRLRHLVPEGNVELVESIVRALLP